MHTTFDIRISSESRSTSAKWFSGSEYDFTYSIRSIACQFITWVYIIKNDKVYKCFEVQSYIQILYSISKYFTNNDLFRKGGIDVIAKRRRCICWTYIVSVYIIDVPNYYSLASFFSFAFFNSIFECTELITSRITVCVGAVFEIVL